MKCERASKCESSPHNTYASTLCFSLPCAIGNAFLFLPSATGLPCNAFPCLPLVPTAASMTSSTTARLPCWLWTHTAPLTSSPPSRCLSLPHCSHIPRPPPTNEQPHGKRYVCGTTQRNTTQQGVSSNKECSPRFIPLASPSLFTCPIDAAMFCESCRVSSEVITRYRYACFTCHVASSDSSSEHHLLVSESLNACLPYPSFHPSLPPPVVTPLPPPLLPLCIRHDGLCGAAEEAPHGTHLHHQGDAQAGRR